MEGKCARGPSRRATIELTLGFLTCPFIRLDSFSSAAPSISTPRRTPDDTLNSRTLPRIAGPDFPALDYFVRLRAFPTSRQTRSSARSPNTSPPSPLIRRP